MNGKNALGILLVIVGSIAVLNFVGVHFGAIFGFLLPFILIGFGIVGWTNNKKWIGGILAAIGGLMLLSKFGGFLVLLLAIGLIIGGVSLFKKNKRSAY
ncbi:LiaF transmembrane domain-containing protein [Paenibacillus sinopodophylli]|uniref:LiaF transmembrane domain-containing protein n=1 Tax=Paenibacillus sinopodophylli TaxID=1837342 RepID=UPI00110D0E2F|nr:hypothetical protein [Paenibacillus sinopodophylli]